MEEEEEERQTDRQTERQRELTLLPKVLHLVKEREPSI